MCIEWMLGGLRLGKLGERWAGAGGTGVLAVMCLVFKILSKNPISSKTRQGIKQKKEDAVYFGGNSTYWAGKPRKT